MDYRIEQLRFQVREDPSSRHFYQLGELLRRQGELEEAVEVLRAGLEHHPEYVAAWVSLGRALFQAERFDESRPAFSRALELDRQNAVAATMLGRAAARLGDWSQAAEALDLAAALVASDEELAREAQDARSHLEPETSADDEILSEEPAEAEDQTAPEPGGPETEPGGEERPAEEPFTVESPPGFPAPVQRSRELAFISEEDPWSVAPRGDTGVFVTGEDVFATATVAELGAPVAGTPSLAEVVPAGPDTSPAVFEAEAAPPVELSRREAPLPEEAREAGFEAPEAALQVEEEPSEELPEAQVEAPPEAEMEPAEVPSSAMVEPPGDGGETKAAMEEGPETGESGRIEPAPTVQAGVTAGEIPLPTATLARLALEQSDLTLAEKTAQAVLERDPGSAEAREILEAVARRRSETAGTPAGTARRKIDVLEDWLGRVRRAAAARIS